MCVIYFSKDSQLIELMCHIIVLTFFSFFHVAEGQVLGIDIGNRFWKAAQIGPGKPFAIVENEKSERKSVNSISLHKGIRAFDEQALQIWLKNPDQVFSSIKSLFPLKELAQITRFLQSHINNNVAKQVNGTILFQYLGAFGESENLTLQQLQGLIFGKIKKLAKDGPGEIDAVITCPADWDIRTRQAFANSAAIGGISVMSMVTENTAAAVHYALSKSSGLKIILLVNLGYESLHLSLVQFETLDLPTQKKPVERVRILKEQTINGIGSFYYDMAVLKLIQEKHKQSIMERPKSVRKAFSVCSKVKESLSASKEVPIFIEDLTPGSHFQSPIQRQMFDLAVIPLVQQVIKLMSGFAGNFANITAVQLIGGGVRVPALVQALANNFKGVQIGTHINGDQAMALGAAFIAANLTATYKVKKVLLQTRLQLSLQAELENGTKLELFAKDQLIGSTTNISISLAQTILNTSFTIILEGQNYANVSFNHLDASIKPMLAKNATQFWIQCMVKLDPVKAVVVEAQLVGQFPTPQSNQLEDGNETLGNATKRKRKPRQEMRTTLTPRIKYAKQGLLNSSQIRKLKLELRKFDKVEKELVELAEKKSGYESQIYSYGDRLQDQKFLQFANQSEITTMKHSLEQNKFWLQERGDSARLGEFVLKKRLLDADFANPINRSIEYKNREATLDKTIKTIKSMQYKLQKFNVMKPWLPKQEVDQLLLTIEVQIENFKELSAETQKQEKHLPPKILGWQMQAFAESVKQKFLKLDTKPKPKVKKPKTKKQDTTPEKQEANETQGKDEKQKAAEQDDYSL